MSTPRIRRGLEGTFTEQGMTRETGKGGGRDRVCDGNAYSSECAIKYLKDKSAESKLRARSAIIKTLVHYGKGNPYARRVCQRCGYCEPCWMR